METRARVSQAAAPSHNAPSPLPPASQSSSASIGSLVERVRARVKLERIAAAREGGRREDA
jgi:hypothetical protein